MYIKPERARGHDILRWNLIIAAFAGIILSLLPGMVTGQFPTAQHRGFEVALHAGYFLPPGRESRFLNVPPEPAFMEMIFASPDIYAGIASQIPGEITGVEPYGTHHIVNYPYAGTGGVFRFGRSLGVYSGFQWQAGRHTLPFGISYFNPSSESTEVLDGEFTATRNVWDFMAGIQYRTSTSPGLFFGAGPMVSGYCYGETEAVAGDYVFTAAPAHHSWTAGLSADAGVVVIDRHPFRLDAHVSVKILFPDQGPLVLPGAGFSFSYHFGRERDDKPHALTQGHVSAFSYGTAAPYYPAHIRPIMEPADTTAATAVEFNPIPYFQIEADPSDIVPGGLAWLKMNRFGDDWAIWQAEWTWIGMDSLHEQRAGLVIDPDEAAIFVHVPATFVPGPYLLSLYFSTGDSLQHEVHLPVPVSSPDRQALINQLDNDQRQLYYSTTDILRRLWRKRDSLTAHRDSLRIAADSAWAARERAEKNARKLVAIDRYLDRLPGIVGPQVDDLLDSLRRLTESGTSIPDTNAIDEMIAAIQSAIDDCNRRTEGMRERQKTLAEEIIKMKKAQEEIMEQIHQLFLANGFTGRYGFKKDGGYSLGYIGDENANTDYGNLPWEQEVYRLKKELKKMNKEYKERLKEQKELPEKIEENEKKCAELQADLEEARKLRAKADQVQALKDRIRKECAHVKALVNDLLKWCKANPDYCTFLDELEEFLKEDCPETPAEWEVFWNKYQDLLKLKKDKEKESEDLVSEKDREIKKIEDAIKDDNTQIDSTWADEVKIRNDEIRMLEDAKKQKQRDEQARKEEEAKQLRKLTDCWEKMAQWLKDNEENLEASNSEYLSAIVQAVAESAGEGAKDAAKGYVSGASTGGMVISGASAALFNLMASLTYLYMQYRVEGAAKKVMDKVMKHKLAPLIHLDEQMCGVITMKDGTSYFYIKVGGKTLLFKIAEGSGLTFEGEVG